MKPKFRVEFLDEASDFLETLEPKARDKIYYNIRKSQVISDKELFEKLNDKIWEFRTLYNKRYYRLFAFWDKIDSLDTIVVSTHGIIKTTAKILASDLLGQNRFVDYILNKNLKKYENEKTIKNQKFRRTYG